MGYSFDMMVVFTYYRKVALLFTSNKHNSVVYPYYYLIFTTSKGIFKGTFSFMKCIVKAFIYSVKNSFLGK